MVKKPSTIPDEFTLSGDTTRQHIMLGKPREPGHCAEKLGVMDAWNLMFGHYPKAVYVDRERIKVKDEGKWWWGPPTDEQIRNLIALDNGKRYALTAHSWEVLMTKKADVVAMTEATKERLKTYADREPQKREPAVRRRIDGLTRMVPKSAAT